MKSSVDPLSQGFAGRDVDSERLINSSNRSQARGNVCNDSRFLSRKWTLIRRLDRLCLARCRYYPASTWRVAARDLE